jgi:hypothetical protein
VAIEALYFFNSDPLICIVTGLKKVNADHLAGYLFLSAWGSCPSASDSYFAAAYLLKEPLATDLTIGRRVGDVAAEQVHAGTDQTGFCC